MSEPQCTTAAGAPLGQRYAALCAACSMGEHTRDGGAHSLVVLDDVSCMVPPMSHLSNS